MKINDIFKIFRKRGVKYSVQFLKLEEFIPCPITDESEEDILYLVMLHIKATKNITVKLDQIEIIKILR